MSATIHCVQYDDEGMYLYRCSKCWADLHLKSSPYDHVPIKSPMLAVHMVEDIALPDTFPIRYCWWCGIPFTKLGL